MKKPGPTSSHPPKAKAKQAAEERAQGKTEGAGQEFSRLFEPEIDAAQNHEDQAGGNKIHRVSPNDGEGPIAAVAGIAGQVPGEGVQDFGNAPGVHGGMTNVGAAFGLIGLDEIEMARGADLEFERGAVTPGGGPKNFPIDGHLAHQVARLIEVAREPSGGRHNGKLEFCFVAIPPGFVESPIGVVQKQAREGE